MSQQKAGMHQPSEKKGPAEKGVNEQKPRPEEAEFSVSCSGKYHSLIQDQARELTHLRQKMKLGRVASALLIQHVKNTLKTFEELLHSNNVDHYMEQHFCEQLAKGSQLAESLARKFSTDDCTSKKNQVGQVPSTLSILRKMHNMSKVTEVLETKWDARSQTQPQIWCSNHTQSTPHHSLSSTSPQLDKEEVHPSVAVVTSLQVQSQLRPEREPPGVEATLSRFSAHCPEVEAIFSSSSNSFNVEQSQQGVAGVFLARA
ncbi:neuroblastoma breakpoint family member 6-like protein isoform X1 [Pongo pygmaeus]|uniref:neuroblastoma breakpoint family member 6-like protein isoform X1 n=1 Tax=Pongo pygmaeus TaxID=9600 RepID=UPI0023E0EEEE|nr:neuroblastoma breakpoint family member 6-like protein isoform X1 [Pongo pygmaeus]XP_054329681.1 neuroblastoma breakpoint family member 6-like protein isoform X1 [Pongo pygmaeus]XP_054330246.1 neuroblastoma breakpoint family member 6-like protein isoform X1 [Pongo pygmaeus]XP_054384505.1 neuroblastoma breakpoint family member 6-like protein isoform X3 [Pongo abelii]